MNLLIIMYKVSPSPFVKYDVINVLYGYAYVARLYNGDHSDFVVEAVEVGCQTNFLTSAKFSMVIICDLLNHYAMNHSIHNTAFCQIPS